MDIGLSIVLGIGLAAAVGFRVFVPLLFIGIAHRMGYTDLAEGFSWLGTTPAIMLLSTATFLEVIAYFIPWFDNLLDTIMTPLAFVAGTVVMASTMIEMAPWIKWTLAIIAGGGTAGLIKTGTAATRAISTASTAGIGNPIIGFIEFLVSSILSFLALIMPLIAISIIVLIVIYYFNRRHRRKLNPKH